jgi:hypothetical protein
VAGGHITDLPVDLKYSSFVIRISVRIGLLIAALDVLDGIFLAHTQNAYMTSLHEGKVWIILGENFGSFQQGWKAVIVPMIYGLIQPAKSVVV